MRVVGGLETYHLSSQPASHGILSSNILENYLSVTCHILFAYANAHCSDSKEVSPEMENQFKQDVYMLMHPLRSSIVDLLEKSSNGMYINELAGKLQSDRQLVSFHLLTLSANQFVEGKYSITDPPHSKGKATKIYKLTDKTREILDKLKSSL